MHGRKNIKLAKLVFYMCLVYTFPNTDFYFTYKLKIFGQ